MTNWYKQDVYDQSDSTIGKIDDVLVSQSGQIDALIIGVGGFLGAGEKDVAVPFNAVKWTSKNNKNYLTMNTTKDALKSAPGSEIRPGQDGLGSGEIRPLDVTEAPFKRGLSSQKSRQK